MFELHPDPGVVPTKPPPEHGERIIIEVDGMPPYKDVHRSVRNARHPSHPAFMPLRQQAIKAMAGRAWFKGYLAIKLSLFVPGGTLEGTGKDLTDYYGGVLDTLDGSHGLSFTYLPIIMQDDHQVSVVMMERGESESESAFYRVEIYFGEDPNW